MSYVPHSESLQIPVRLDCTALSPFQDCKMTVTPTRVLVVFDFDWCERAL